jgi:predicted secreted protein
MAKKGVVNSLSQGTLTDAGTLNLELDAAFSSDNTLSVTILATQDTGTTAGTAKLQQSVDGVNYADVAGLSSLTLTNGASTVWSINQTPAYKYRVNSVGAGTQSTFIDVSYIFK